MTTPTKYRSYFVLSDVPVTGYFRHNSSFQILPAPPEAPRPPCVVGAYPLMIELAYPASSSGRQSPLGHEVDVEIVNAEIAQEKLKQLLLLLTAFTSYELFVPSNHQGWFITLGKRGEDAPDWTPRWGQEMYPFSGSDQQHKINNFTIPTASLIKQVDPVAYFNMFGRPMEQVFELPATISQLLNAADSLGNDARHALLSSCSLLSQGLILWQAHPSLSFASCVSALEALIAFDHKNEPTNVCMTCGQNRYSVMKKFQAFFARYGNSSPEFKKYAQKVYRYRSKILHRGELLLGDVIQPKFASLDGYEDRELHRNLIRTCRICIVNWVHSQYQP